MQGTGREEALVTIKIIKTMIQKVFIIENLSEVFNVASNRAESGTIEVRNMTLREYGTRQTYLVTLYGDDAVQSYVAGELVMAVLKFKVAISGGRPFQNITAEEVLPMTGRLPERVNSNNCQTF